MVPLSEAEADLIRDHPECGTVALDIEYAYSFTYNKPKLDLSIIACCPGLRTFGNNWVVPSGYKIGNSNAPALWDNVEEDSSIGLKQIIVINVCILIAICCCVGGYLYYKEKKTKQRIKDL